MSFPTEVNDYNSRAGFCRERVGYHSNEHVIQGVYIAFGLVTIAQAIVHAAVILTRR